jgi:hypothetical protein
VASTVHAAAQALVEVAKAVAPTLSSNRFWIKEKLEVLELELKLALTNGGISQVLVEITRPSFKLLQVLLQRFEKELILVVGNMKVILQYPATHKEWSSSNT